MDHPMQSQDKIQDTYKLSPPLEQEKGEINALGRENLHNLHHQSNPHEEQSSIASFENCENGEKEEKLETAHEGTGEGEKPLTTDGENMEERELELVGPRERLKRHRTEVAGQVWIPDMWGQEDFLKDWIDCSAFDSCLVSHQDIMSARASLAEEGRRASSGRLRVQNSC